MLQLRYKTLQFELNNIQGEINPVNFRKIRYHKSHTKCALADMVKTAMRITAVLPKQCIKMAVESFMWSITFKASPLSITDHILSSLDPFNTALDKEIERVLISLTSCLMVSVVHILDAKEGIGAGLGVHGCH
jgi:hypothetical protein